MSKLIIVCGLPGSGKTTLASELSKKMKVACIHKDSIKEKFFESMKLSSLDDSKKIGKPTVDVMLHLAEEQLKNGIDIMIESPFNFPEDYSLFELWKEKYDLDLYSVICSIDYKERARRFLERERHHAHFDNERSIHLADGPEYDYATIPGKQIRIVTNKPTTELIEEIMEKMKENKALPAKG